MAEVQAEFDKLIESIGADDEKFKEVENQLKELITKGAKLAYKAGVFTDLIDSVQFAYPIWYLDNVEDHKDLIGQIGIVLSNPELGTLQIVMRSTKYEYYLSKLVESPNPNVNDTMRRHFRQLLNIPEVKEAPVATIEAGKDYQEEFDAILKAIYEQDTEFSDVKDKLNLMLLSGVRLTYYPIIFDTILQSSDVDFGVWYLDNVDITQETIDDVSSACSNGGDCNSPILEIVMRCKKYKSYLEMIANHDKVDAELRDNIKKLIKN